MVRLVRYCPRGSIIFNIYAFMVILFGQDKKKVTINNEMLFLFPYDLICELLWLFMLAFEQDQENWKIGNMWPYMVCFLISLHVWYVLVVI